MKQRKLIFKAILMVHAHLMLGQDQDSATISLDPITITGYKAMNGVGHFYEVQDGIIYAGKKTEVILIDSIDANKAINNTRQVLGRIPGLNINESETGGFVSNGVSIRGLNPNQSRDLNVRQNGYNISADVYGYNEAYFLPPLEAVERIEILKGASSLQFGSQFGLINYVLKKAPAKPIGLTASMTGGNYGLMNSFISLGGSVSKFSYQGYLQHRNYSGWRENSDQVQTTGFLKLSFNPTEKLNLSVEYSLLRNKIHMPGGLTDDQYNSNSQTSFRERNWVTSPWNVISGNLEYQVNPTTSIRLNTAFNGSSRKLVWFDEDPDEMDVPDLTTGQFEDREVEKKYMRSTSNEVRFLKQYSIGKSRSNLAAGVRYAHARMEQLEDGIGTNGSDEDYSVPSNYYEEELDFSTNNFAVFAENVFHFGDRLSVTPGIRFEHLASSVAGELEDSETGTEFEADNSLTRQFIVGGIGAELTTNEYTTLFLNATQSYNPVTYSQIVPLGVISRVDPNLKDSKGYNIELGYRGTVKNLINFDLSYFYMTNDNRIGLQLVPDGSGGFYTYRTNVASSVHQGLEGYGEINLHSLFKFTPDFKLSLFNSIMSLDAQYDSGPFKGNRVEYAPKMINRAGVSFSVRKFSSTIQHSYQGSSYGDANNSVTPSSNGVVGKIPSNSVFDWSFNYYFRSIGFRGGINNFSDEKYFTYRTDEYPGPGIIPAIGRSFYFGLSVKI